jgi:hypothetical protein
MPRSSQIPAIYQLKITLAGIRPPIWRRILVRSDVSLGELHTILLRTMGWHGGHLHMFEAGGREYGDAERSDPWGPPIQDEDQVRLDAVLPRKGSKLKYEYDFGDDWTHSVQLEEVLPFDPEQRTPVCLKGKRRCPPEDSGGPYGYAEMLEALGSRRHPEHKHWLEWVGDDFDAEEFSVEAINSALARLQHSAGASAGKTAAVKPAQPAAKSKTAAVKPARPAAKGSAKTSAKGPARKPPAHVAGTILPMPAARGRKAGKTRAWGRRGLAPPQESDGFVRKLTQPLDDSFEARTHFEFEDFLSSMFEDLVFGAGLMAEELSDLLDRIGAVHFEDELALVVEACTRLFEALTLDVQPEESSRRARMLSELSDELADTFLAYLHALYETTPLELRPQRLLSEVERLYPMILELPTLEDMSEIAQRPLPQLEELLPAWLAQLRSRPPGPGALHAVAWARLLLEAVERLEGTEAAAELARKGCPERPELLQDWFDLLVWQERLDEAEAAVTRALQEAGDPERKAHFTDWLAGLAHARGQSRQRQKLLQQAWRLKPSWLRLLWMYLTTPNARREALAAAERKAAQSGKLEPGERLGCLLDLLAADVGAAAARLERSSVLGWSEPDHPGSLAWPALLLAASGEPRPPRSSALDQFCQAFGTARWDLATAAGLPHWTDFEIESLLPEDELLPHGEMRPHAGPASRSEAIEVASYLAGMRLVSDALAAHPPTEEQRRELLPLLGELAAARARAIVRSLPEAMWQQAAWALAAFAEAAALAGSALGEQVLADARRELAEHTAFLKHLAVQEGESSVLTQLRRPPASPRRGGRGGKGGNTGRKGTRKR